MRLDPLTYGLAGLRRCLYWNDPRDRRQRVWLCSWCLDYQYGIFAVALVCAGERDCTEARVRGFDLKSGEIYPRVHTNEHE